MKTYKKGELKKAILLLSVGVIAIPAVCVAPGLAILFKSLNAKSSKDRYRVQRTMNGMKANGLLVRQIKNGEEVLVVTDKGKEEAWSALNDNMRISKQKKWDKKWRIVTFDIPETKLRIRREVSHKLKDIGMEAIQNSVFITPYPCKNEIDKITGHYGISKFFIYLETNYIESNKDLLKKFNLVS
jgi:DNA-binding transcriptional regulator PaaX